jgi:peptide/nickel transport system substrate-binding protein
VSLSEYASFLFEGLDGARACFREPAACDLSGAIEVDGSDVTFTLTRPDPDLLYKMALPLASVVPSTTPAE